ncbi:MerR family transcriptional regulator [Arthrobacter agilis]|uniref:MerR family transcriptional regulator n=1 Tax=Arthrobacter agilis TaxID=37921 RepID=UPI0027D773BF|nr:MerR family transcriptional regulator [Arthrobacter agilis]
MSSGSFARRTRLSSKALRLYAGNGLLAPAHVDPGNGYRYYDDGQIADARLIILLRGLDMPLGEIAHVLAAAADERPGLVAAYRDGVEATQLAQRHLASYVMSHLTRGEDRPMNVTTRSCDAMTYVTEKRRVDPAGIPDFIRSSCARLAPVAERLGGWAGPLTTIYRSPVNDDTDGVVENAIPVRSGVRPADVTAPTSILVEPAGELAYARITQAQVQYPQILQAYDEVYAWLAREGLTPSLPPREIYFAPFDDAHPEAEVCDIAVPFHR